jgi:hypothetical protein
MYVRYPDVLLDIPLASATKSAALDINTFLNPIQMSFNTCAHGNSPGNCYTPPMRIIFFPKDLPTSHAMDTAFNKVAAIGQPVAVTLSSSLSFTILSLNEASHVKPVAYWT